MSTVLLWTMAVTAFIVTIMGGVLLAGVIIGLASAGLLGVFSALFAV